MADQSLQWAWRCHQGRRPDVLVKKQIPIPKCAPNGVLVKMLAMGVCHSDCLIIARPEPLPGCSEFTLGHEGAGEILEIGSENPNNLKIGDKVSIHIVPGRGKCRECTLGFRRLCKQPDNGGYGLEKDGFMQEVVAARADACVKIPEGVRIEDAAIAADAILTAFHAIKYTGEVGPEDTVAIIGLGGLGLNGVQIVKHLGVREENIYVMDKKAEAVKAAIRLGVKKENAFCSGDEEYEKKPMHEVLAERGVGIDKVVDFVGHDQTHITAQRIVRPAGTIVVVGLLSMQTPLLPGLMVTKCYTIKGTFAGEMEGLKECLNLLAKGVIRPQLSTASINGLPQVLKDLDDGKYEGRKVLLPEWTD
ncbi:alcohol dehydrogenase [Pseudocercospora fuligena]|uniref:Alcohol dehydrogenase n=1 Tax=Pseudocercospora fuligena TaxID=685502 RepID=A0A8H6VKU1_9PEZI|nr:alcohol dehydrogenase [Pseudocercospora fuligena]